MTSSESPHPPTPQPRPRRKSTRQINALLKKMVQLKIVQPGQNNSKEDNNSIVYTPTPQFA